MNKIPMSENDIRETLDTAVIDANNANLVVNNTAYKEAFKAREKQIFEQFCSSKLNDSDIRDDMWRTMQNLQSLQQYFYNAVTTGNMAKERLESINNEKSIN